ncbi:MAG: hypothetical protein J6X65_09325 [Bacteroidales bacterium]|jgi:hypothetical protein|nr:hypothetical protein [Bacteroidales bacterium]
MEKNSPFDGMGNAKNKICQSIREALATPVHVPDINTDQDLFAPIPDLLGCFQQNFEAAGGKLVPFNMDLSLMNDRTYAANFQKQVYDYLKNYELETSRCMTVLNTSSHLAPVLANFNIPTIDFIRNSEPVDAVIVYAEFLIARTGSIVLSQRGGLMLYPSIRNLARNIIVLSQASRIIPDLRYLTESMTTVQQKENRGEEVDFDFDMLEIIRPGKTDDASLSPTQPHFSLLLVVDGLNNYNH